MSRLTRVHLRNIGHEDSFIKNLTLELDGEHTNIVLRNGGGKTAILSLAFATVLPRKNDFLGRYFPPTKQRNLRDYLRPNEQSLVVLEWTRNDGDLGFPTTFLSGVLYDTKADGDPDRLFFGLYPQEDKHDTLLENLPFELVEENGQRRRTTMREFKNWLSSYMPDSSVAPFPTENQGEWSQYLASKVGIDPELHKEMVRMNASEGGVADAVNFKSSEEFVNYLLKITLPESRYTSVDDNLNANREALATLVNQHLPESELLERVLDPLEALANVATARHDLRTRLGDIQQRIDQTIANVETERSATHEALERLARQTRDAEAERASLRKENQETNGMAAGLRVEARRTLLGAAQSAREQHEARTNVIGERVAIAATLPTLADFKTASQEYDAFEAALERAREGASSQRAIAVDRAALLADRLQGELEYLNGLLVDLETQREDLGSRIGSEDKEERRLRSDANDLNHTAKSLEKEVQKLERLRTKLEAAGHLHVGEDPRTAEQRHTKVRDQLKVALTELQKKQEREEARAQDLAGEVKAREAERVETERAWEEVRRKHQEGIERSAALMQHPIFTRIREQDASFDLDTTGSGLHQHLDDLQREAAKNVEEATREYHRVERLQNQINERGLLSVSEDVEELLLFLKNKGISAWSTAEYIAKQLKANDDERRIRHLIARHPARSVGITVHPPDVTAAQEALREYNPAITPTVVTSSTDVLRDEAPELSEIDAAFEPTSLAAFHLPSALTLRDGIMGKHEQAERNLRHAQQEERRVTEAITQLAAYQKDFPPGRLADLTRETGEAEQQHAKAEEAVGRARTSSAEHADYLRDLEKKLDQHGDNLQEAEEALGAVVSHVREGGHEVGLKQEQARAHKAKQRELEEAADACHERAAALRNEVEVLRKQEGGHEGRLRDLQAQRETVVAEWCPDREGSPTREADLSALQRSYEQAVRDYEEQYRSADQQGRLAQLKANKESAWKSFQRSLNDGVTAEAAEVALAEAGTWDADHLTQEAANLRKEHAALQRNHEPRFAEKEAERLLEEAETEGASYEGIQLPDDLVTLAAHRPSEALLEVDHLLEAVGDRDARIADLDDLLQGLERDRAETDRRSREWREAHGALEKLLDTPILQHQLPPEEAIGAESLPLREVAPEVDGLLKWAQREWDVLNDERGSVAGRIRGMANNPDYDRLGVTYMGILRGSKDEDLERVARAKHAELTARLDTIRLKIASREQAMDATVRALYDLAKDGVANVNKAQRKSRVTVAGEDIELIRITYSRNHDMEGIKTKIRDMLRRVLTPDSNEKSDAKTLVKEAAKFFYDKQPSIRVRHPDLDHPRPYLQMRELGTKSGGESLTAVLIVFCILARLRKEDHESIGDGRFALLLDNPYGKASSLPFIDLQHAVAEALGIQLVFLTAIESEPMLSRFANLIRLVNAKRDQYGRRHLMFESRRVGLNDGLGNVSHSKRKKHVPAPQRVARAE